MIFDAKESNKNADTDKCYSQMSHVVHCLSTQLNNVIYKVMIALPPFTNLYKL